MTAKDTVEALLSLQDIDETIEEKEAELASLAPRVQEREEGIADVRQRLESARSRLESAEEEYRKSQRSVQAGRATLKRLRDRANQVEDLRQHMAVRAELDAARKNLEMAENQALSDLQDVETARDAVEQLEAELEEAEADFEEDLGEVEARREELEEELARQRDQREDRSEDIQDEALALYEQVRKGRTQSALAPLAGGHCGNCFTAVPLQRQNEIRSGSRLYRCEGCGVILHAPVESGNNGAG